MLQWDEISPLLDATYELLNERPDGSVRDEHVEALLPGMEPKRVRKALALLKDMEYIGAYRAAGGRIDSIQPRERGCRRRWAGCSRAPRDQWTSSCCCGYWISGSLQQRLPRNARASSGCARRLPSPGRPWSVKCSRRGWHG